MSDARAAEVVAYAIDNGVRAIDTAAFYALLLNASRAGWRGAPDVHQ